MSLLFLRTLFFWGFLFYYKWKEDYTVELELMSELFSFERGVAGIFSNPDCQYVEAEQSNSSSSS